MHLVFSLQIPFRFRSHLFFLEKEERKERETTKTKDQENQTNPQKPNFYDSIMALTAAERTFAIPELLETILIQLARQHLPRRGLDPLAQRQLRIPSRGLDSSTSHYLAYTPLVYQLFVLQRVNSTFRGVLRASKELRQWMYPDPHSRMLEVDHDDEEEEEGHQHQGIETLIRLAWLFSYVGLRVCHHHNHVQVKDGGGSGSGSSSITKEVLLTKHPRESPHLWPRGFESEDQGVRRFARPESSWRKIVMFDDNDDDDDIDDIDDDDDDENDKHRHVTRRRRIGNVQVEVWVVKSNENTTPSYVQTWNFHREEKPTLGDVYDGLKILYGRTQEQHAKIAEQEQQQEQEQEESWQN